MRRAEIFLAGLILLCAVRHAAALENSRAELFLRALAAADSTALDSLIDPSARVMAARLGIHYTDQPFKALIGTGLEVDAARALRVAGQMPRYRITDLGDGFSRLELEPAVPGRGWYFRDRRLVSPLAWFTRGWHLTETTHLRVLSADSLDTTLRCAGLLESFTVQVLDRLEFPDSTRQRLERQKIVYVMCRDEDEFERLTGWRARGVCLLAWDCVVSVWPCHYHELVHELVNLRLGTLASDTHPLFLEGLAVGLGGRGGREVRVILDLAAFLVGGGLLDYPALLERSAFQEQDASLSYPVAGLYNRFLLEHLGTARYLALYRRYNAPAGSPQWRAAVDPADLPPEHAWRQYLEHRTQFEGVSLEGPPSDTTPLAAGEGWSVWSIPGALAFSLTDSLFVGMPPIWDSRSPSFSRQRPVDLGGATFLVTVDSEEIRLIDRTSGNLSANFVQSLSLAGQSVPQNGGRFQFRLARSLFLPERPNP